MSHDVTDFQKEVLERSGEIPVLVDFWAEWCAPCKILGPVLERLAQEADGRWILAKVDTEVHQTEAAAYNIRSIPNVKLFVDGKVTAEFAGALPEPMVRQWLQKNVPGKFQSEVLRAEELMHSGQTESAREVLATVVEQEPGNHHARTLLAQLFLFAEPERAEQMVEGIEEDSDYFDTADAVRTIAGLVHRQPESLPEGSSRQEYADAVADLRTRKFAAALEKFIDIIRNDRYYDDDGSRKACVAIFKILGEEHDITQKYRREFSRALY